MANAPTRAQRRRWTEIAYMGCIICGGPAEVHHIHTGAGGRKNHDKTIALCFQHHTGKKHGIHGDLQRRGFEAIHGTEAELLSKTEQLLSRRNAA